MENSPTNALGQPIGSKLENWQSCSHPSRTVMQGHYCELQPLDPQVHAEELFGAFAEDSEGRNWTYLLSEPFTKLEDFKQWLVNSCSSQDPLFYVVIDKTNSKAVGMAALMRIVPETGVIEVGNIHFSTSMQKTAMATEAMFLLMQRVFDQLGYRRYEWKCDNCNGPSKKAAARLGFSFEGVFRQALIYKQRNRDTAWFSILDTEWPRQKVAFVRWLSPDNFDAQGIQKHSLQHFLD